MSSPTLHPLQRLWYAVRFNGQHHISNTPSLGFIEKEAVHTGAVFPARSPLLLSDPIASAWSHQASVPTQATPSPSTSASRTTFRKMRRRPCPVESCLASLVVVLRLQRSRTPVSSDANSGNRCGSHTLLSNKRRSTVPCLNPTALFHGTVVWCAQDSRNNNNNGRSNRNSRPVQY